MDSVSLIVSALVAGAVAAGQEMTPQAVRDGYGTLQTLLYRHFAPQPDLVDAVEKVTARPDSAARQEVLKEELERAKADEDQELVALARRLLDLVAEVQAPNAPTYHATNTGSGAIAQGPGAVAAGHRGVAAGGNLTGNTIITGNNNVVGHQNRVTHSSTEPAKHPLPATHHSPLATPLTLLLLAANPIDTPRLQIEEEVRAIDQAMRQGAFHEHFDLRPYLALRLDDLQDQLLRFQPHLVHFSGHGSPRHELLVQDAQGQAVAIPTPALGNLFRLLRDNIRCVVLNACYSVPQAAAIAEHIDCVIGISDAIEETAARQFSIAFYRALAYGRTVETAFELGKSQLDLHRLAAADQPQLLGKADPAQVRLVIGD
ncbi:MAG: hypothetical protein R3C14_38065 [Caldilineaceae bacterium]